MTNGLPVVPLGKFLTQRKEFFTIDDFVKYKRARVQSHGQGIVLRDEVNGTEIKTKKQQAARTGEFLVAEIDAKVGGFGIVPPELDGAVVSSHYFLFEIDKTKCLKEWLNWFVRYNSLEEQTKAQGSTNYAAIRPNDVLNFEIPLPPLTEQRRIVGHIESLARQVNEAQRLREEAEKETDALTSAISKEYFAIDNGINVSKLGDISTRLTKGESPNWQGFSYQDNGVIFVRSENVLWGELNLSSPTYISVEFHNKLSRSKLNTGDVLINLVGASIGRTCVVPSTIGDANVNQAVGVISPNSDVLDSNYLMHFLLNPLAQYVIHGGKVETARPNISLGDLRELLIPVPPLDEQQRIVGYLDGLPPSLRFGSFLFQGPLVKL